MSGRIQQSSRSYPTLEWENAPLLRQERRRLSVLDRLRLPALVAAFVLGLAIGMMI